MSSSRVRKTRKFYHCQVVLSAKVASQRCIAARLEDMSFYTDFKYSDSIIRLSNGSIFNTVSMITTDWHRLCDDVFDTRRNFVVPAVTHTTMCDWIVLYTAFPCSWRPPSTMLSMCRFGRRVSFMGAQSNIVALADHNGKYQSMCHGQAKLLTLPRWIALLTHTSKHTRCTQYTLSVDLFIF